MPSVYARIARANRLALDKTLRLNSDGTMTLCEADRQLTRAQVREAAELIIEHFRELEKLWETYC